MRTYTCHCGNTLYFENTQCLQCGRELGFDPVQLQLVALDKIDNESYASAADPQRTYKKCTNYHTAHVCNWLVNGNSNNTFCTACDLNAIIPDLTSEQNRQRWLKLEKAKRRLIYTLLSLELPPTSFREDAERGMAFRFMEDIKELNPYSDEMVTYEQIMTGHDSGVITINIIEADDSAREEIRERMNEAYRTLLGHFRHESGHYYWDRFISKSEHLEEFRQLFGDERHDYQVSLERYYQQGPVQDWMDQYISAYASAHPWEDWAESWAHYLHCIDFIETATHHRIGIEGEELTYYQGEIRDWIHRIDFNRIIQRLAGLMRTLNELNRSLGLSDPYPFELSPGVIQKLAFIHKLVLEHTGKPV